MVPRKGETATSRVSSWFGWTPSSTDGIRRSLALNIKASRTTEFVRPAYDLPRGGVFSTSRLWKLNWFLRDFGYDTDLLGRDEIDERALVGLRGISTRLSGRSLNLERFAPVPTGKRSPALIRTPGQNRA